MMNHFIKLNGKMIALNGVKCIINDRDQVVIVTLKGLSDDVLVADFDQLKKKLKDIEYLRYIELVGEKVGSQYIKDDGRPYEAYVNLNLVSQLREDWEGEISFVDGSSMESCASYAGLLSRIKPVIINE